MVWILLWKQNFSDLFLHVRFVEKLRENSAFLNTFFLVKKLASMNWNVNFEFIKYLRRVFLHLISSFISGMGSSTFIDFKIKIYFWGTLFLKKKKKNQLKKLSV